MSDLTSGELVRLKSGGPNMTTAGLSYGEMICKWFDEKNTPMTESFPPECLVRVEKDDDEVLGMAV